MSALDVEKHGQPQHHETADLDKKESAGGIAPALSFTSATVAPEDRDEAYDFLKAVGDKSPWTPEEERRIKRKVDARVLTIMFFNVALSYIDGATLGVAAIFGIGPDTGLYVLENGVLNTDNYSNAALIYYVGSIAGAWPISFCLQRFPIRNVLSILTICWGITFACTAACSTYGQIMAVRFLLGFSSASVLPSIGLLSAQWYTKEEQALRTGVTVAASGFASIFAPLIAYGLFKIPNVTQATGAMAGPWKAPFIFWGPLTFFYGIATWFIIPSNPFTAKFLNEREKYIAVERLRGEQSSVENRHFKKGQVFELIKDHRYWLWLVILIMISIDNGPVTSFTAIIIFNILGDPFQVLLLIMPIAALAALCMVGFGWLASRVPNIRTYLVMFFLVPPIISLALLWKLDPAEHKWGLYVCTILNPLFSVSYAQHVSFGISNVAGYTKKAFVSGSILVGYCLGAIIGPLLFLGSEAPKYPTAFKTVLAIEVVAIFMSLLYRFDCQQENRRRDRLGAVAEKDRAFLDLTDKENLSFRYTL